ncbi:MAG: hypothetical protein IJY00_02245 [Bacteroidaceae bacterium]|nr:hypothetical protein [Bacteroidaceae bacterium]
MKKILLAAFALTGLTGLTAGAQGIYQFADPSFENWDAKDEPGKGWTSFSSADASALSGIIGTIAKNQSPRPAKVEGHTGSTAVKLLSKSIANVPANGNLTTGQIHMGSATPDDPSNYNSTMVGDASHSLVFAVTPDAVGFYAKFKSGGSENGRGNFILHDECEYKDPEVTDQAANRIGKATALIPATEAWTYFEAPFVYDRTEKPATQYLLASFTTNPVAGGSAGDELIIDDVYFIYYSTLSALSYDGNALDVTGETKNFDLSLRAYNKEKLAYTAKGAGATVETAYNESTGVLTITVKGNDFEANSENYTTYTIQFAKPVDVTNVVGAYSSMLMIDLGEGSEPTPGVRVSLTEGTELSTVNFELLDFDGLGDIVLPNIRLIGKGNSTYGFGENAPVNLTLSGDIKATATLNIEKSSVEGDNLTAYVDVNWVDDDGNIISPIPVNAIGPKIYPLTITDGETINAQAGAYDVTLTRSFAKGWSTLCLPFDMNPAEFGVKGVKVQEFSAATGNSLDFKAVETITANVPYLIYFPEAVNAGVTLLTKTITSLNAQAVQKGEYTFKGSYEGSISMSGKYGVADVNGVQKIMRGGSSSTLKCTRAYFEYNGTDNVQGMRLNLEGGNVTGIDGITTGDTDAETPLYDLSGRRVQNATKGGIYIRNGKKIIK